MFSSEIVYATAEAVGQTGFVDHALPWLSGVAALTLVAGASFVASAHSICCRLAAGDTIKHALGVL